MKEDNGLIKSVTDPLQHLKDKVNKEHSDVEKSMDSINHTMKGIIKKIDKIKSTDSKDRLKEYRKQVKSSNKYLDSLFESLRHEMIEHAEAEYDLEKAEEKRDETK